MKNDQKINSTTEAWESRELGADTTSAKKVSPEIHQQINDAMGLQMISIRLSKSLIETFKMLGQIHGVGYQPLMRDALDRFATAEMKSLLSGMAESQKKLKGKAAEPRETPRKPTNGKKAA